MFARVSLEDRGKVSGMVLETVREVVVRPAQRSSRAYHGRQRKEVEVQDRGFAVGSLRRPWWKAVVRVAMRLMMVTVLVCCQAHASQQRGEDVERMLSARCKSVLVNEVS